MRLQTELAQVLSRAAGHIHIVTASHPSVKMFLLSFIWPWKRKHRKRTGWRACVKLWRGLQWIWTQEIFRSHSALWGLDGQEPKTLHSWPVYFLFFYSSWLEKTAAPCHLVKKSSNVETGNDSPVLRQWNWVPLSRWLGHTHTRRH